LIFDKGDCFTRCPKCRRLCEWELLESLVPDDAADEEHEDQAA
jgi:hypothetical protein